MGAAQAAAPTGRLPIGGLLFQQISEKKKGSAKDAERSDDNTGVIFKLWKSKKEFVLSALNICLTLEA